ncbi:MAG: hypothetical protein ACRDD1_18255 [Planctomycetia bacterium]
MQAAVDWAADEQFHPPAVRLLAEFLDDEDEEVRRHVERIFHKENLLEQQAMRPFLAAFVRSRSFLDHPRPLLHALRDHAGPLRPLADLVAAVVDAFTTPPPALPFYDAVDLGPLLFRLYEQAKSPPRPRPPGTLPGRLGRTAENPPWKRRQTDGGNRRMSDAPSTAKTS